MLAPQLAGAHASPLTYLPAAASSLTETPQSISIRFSERLEPKASSIVVFTDDGTNIAQGDAVVAADNPYVLSVPVGHAGTGAYTVSWQVISADDGHFTKGAYVFFVGEAEERVVAHTALHVFHQTTFTEAFTIWLELLGQTILIASLTLYFLLRKDVDESESITKKLRDLNKAAIAFIVIGVIGYVMYRSVDLVTITTTFPEAVVNFSQTVAGRFALYRAIIALLCLPLLTSNRMRNQRWNYVLGVLMLTMALMRARVSHAAASHVFPDLAIGIMFIHLVGKSLWIGGLVVLSAAFLSSGEKFANVLRKFSSLCTAALAIGGASGAYVVWLHLKGFGNIEATLWGTRLVWLTGFAIALLALRLYNQFKPKQELLRKTLIAETVTALCVLWLSSMLVITTPPLYYQAPYFVERGEMIFSSDPYDPAHMLLRFDATDITEVTVTLMNEEKNIGPLVPQVDAYFGRDFVFHTREFSLPGLWKIDVTAKRESGYDIVGNFELSYPDDLQEDRASPKPLFTVTCVVVGLITILLSYFLHRLNKR